MKVRRSMSVRHAQRSKLCCVPSMRQSNAGVVSSGERIEPMVPWTRYAGMVASEGTETHAWLFWSGGCQAIRLPRGLRLPGDQMVVRWDGKTLVLEPSLARPIRRRKPRSSQRRRRR